MIPNFKRSERKLATSASGGFQISNFLIISLVLVNVTLSGQQALRTIGNDAFAPGETLKYRVFYDSWLTNWMTAGYGSMTISESDRQFYERKVYHIVVTGKSAGLFNLFYKVDDCFETYLDQEAIIPWYFIRRTKEGSYIFKDDVAFDQFEQKYKSSRMEKTIPPNLQDIVSAFYYMRTFDFDSAEVNDEYYLDFYLDDSIYTSRVIFLGREYIETKQGVFRCMKFKPQVAQGEIFQEPYPMVIWVTDDRNKIPVLIKSAVYVGSVSIELIKYSGLLYPIEALVE